MNVSMYVSSVARHTFSLYLNQDDLMRYMWSATKASQKCCIIESRAPSQLHGLPHETHQH